MGGTLVVGVKEGGEIVGLRNPEQAQRALQNAAQRAFPTVSIQSEVVELDGKSILVAEIQKSEAIHYRHIQIKQD